MQKYTTGELAKLCCVSVRTVQYYDNIKLLTPSELSEGGRRLYLDADLNKMQIICFLRQLGFSIENITILFSDSSSDEVISALIEQKEEEIKKQLKSQKEQLKKLSDVKKSLKSMDTFSVSSIADATKIIKNRSKRKRMLLFMIIVGIIMDIIEIGTLIYGVLTDNFIPIIVGLPIVIALGIFISCYYYGHITYICPHCHNSFLPSFKKVFFSSHTPNTRRLTCPFCGYKSFCIETYPDKK